MSIFDLMFQSSLEPAGHRVPKSMRNLVSSDLSPWVAQQVLRPELKRLNTDNSFQLLCLTYSCPQQAFGLTWKGEEVVAGWDPAIGRGRFPPAPGRGAGVVVIDPRRASKSLTESADISPGSMQLCSEIPMQIQFFWKLKFRKVFVSFSPWRCLGPLKETRNFRLQSRNAHQAPTRLSWFPGRARSEK